MQSNYVCPKTKESLREVDDGLLAEHGSLYPFVGLEEGVNIPDFVAVKEQGKTGKQSLDMYDQKASAEFYTNYLNWLFQTFQEDELSFRENLVAKLNLQRGNRVLITGCGLGDDIQPVIDIIGPDGEIYANDLAGEMVVAASRLHNIPGGEYSKNTFFSVCDAKNLPFMDNYFDGAFHFGGINLFDDIKLSVEEMNRVVKPGGRVVFGDEGVAPWLKDTEYARIAINNNLLWASEAPIDLLPEFSMDVHLSWVLGNCFFVIDFEVSSVGPFMNIDIHNKGLRGGNMRTRYFGLLEGVTEKAKKFVIEDAGRNGISVHEWLERAIKDKQSI